MSDQNSNNEKHQGSQPPEPATVMVNKDALDKLVKRVEDQQQQIGFLMEAADKKRLDLVQRRHQAPMPKVIGVHRFQGKYVESTAMKANEAFHDQNGNYVERQELEIKFFDDPKAITVPYRQYGIQHEKIPADVLSATTDSTGKTTLTVQVKEDGSKLTIDSRFIN